MFLFSWNFSLFFLFFNSFNQNGSNWNLELAHLAELLARACIFQHDQCRKTATRIFHFFTISWITWFFHGVETYSMSGQNIASIRNSRMYKGQNITIQQMFESWFAEYNNANMNYIWAYLMREPRLFIVVTSCYLWYSRFLAPTSSTLFHKSQ